MPNIYFLVLRFFHLLALSLWVGGIAMIGFVVAPTTFKLAETRQQAGKIVGAILKRFDYIQYGCIAVLFITSGFMIKNWGVWSPYYLVKYIAVALMSLSSIFSATVLSPRMEKLLQQAGGTFELDSDTNVNKIKFNNLHRWSTAAMTFNFLCGLIALLFS